MNATATPWPLFIPEAVAERATTRFVLDPSTGCHISTYSTASHGYAQIGWNHEKVRTVTLVHRVVWAIHHGTIPRDLTVDHMCKNRRCMNVQHLRLLSNYENGRRTRGRDWPLGRCVNGHPNEHLKKYGNGRTHCSICVDTRWKAAPKGATPKLRVKSVSETKISKMKPRKPPTSEIRPKQPRPIKQPAAPRTPAPPKTHCRNGHAKTEENTYLRPSGYKECLPCKTAHATIWHGARRCRKTPTT